MGTQYKTSDGTWKDLTLPTSMTDHEAGYRLDQLTERVEEVEALLQGLADFAGVSI